MRRPNERLFDFVYQPLFDRAGAVEGIAAVVYDVTELVARAASTPRSPNRAKDEFLAMLGHELRNPLAPILTALQLLRLRGIDAGERERDVIERQVRHLVGLVDDLLDVSRITRGKIRAAARARGDGRRRREGDRNGQSAARAAAAHADGRRAARGAHRDADPDRLAQVVSNLLTNAAKYTEPGRPDRRDRHAGERDAVVLGVVDSGIGIAPEMLPTDLRLVRAGAGRRWTVRAAGSDSVSPSSAVSSRCTAERCTADSAGRGRGA